MAAKKKGKKHKGEGKKGKKHAKAKKKAGGSAKKAAKQMAPIPVKTGKGATPAEVAARVTELLRAGNSAAVENELFASGIESVEGLGMSLAWSGRKSVLAKYRAWEADHEIHSMQVEGPWVGATGFVLKLGIDVSQKSTGQRVQMQEMAVYTVRNGKITREEFHFPTGG